MYRTFSVTIAAMLCILGCNRNSYEVIERSDKPVPDFQGIGIHTEIDYVLSHDGHKIYATCDFARFESSDPENTCGFRPLHSYECVVGNDSITKGNMWDLKCKDADGHNVYLYVSKKE